MPPLALRRLLLVASCVAGAMLACAYSDQPIQTAEPDLATPLPPPPTSTPGPTATATTTAVSPEPTATQPAPTSTRLAATSTRPPDTVTPGPSPTLDLTQVPIGNGNFDADLTDWSISDPARGRWVDGYVRLDAGGEAAVTLARTVAAPTASLVTLHFRYRSETAAGGDCTLETMLGEARTFLENNQWRDAEVDYTALAGTEVEVGVTARSSNGCSVLHFDEFYWLVPAGEPPHTATAPATANPIATPTSTAGPAAIAAGAIFTRQFTVKPEGDVPYGLPMDLRDNQTITWASLRNGQGRWLFDLGSTQTLAGLRLVAHRDRDQDTTLLGIDVSLDGLNWVTVLAPATACGDTPACLVVAQATPVDLPFGPVEARHVRLRSGPTALALAEVELAVLP